MESFLKLNGKRGKVFSLKNFYNNDKKSFLVTDGNDNYAHGITIKKAKKDLLFKIDENKNLESFKSLKLDSKISFKKAIECYRLITGACELGVKDFIETNNIKNKYYTIKEIIDLTKNKYRNDEFKQFLTIKKLKFMKKKLFKIKDVMMGDYNDFEQSSPSYLMENVNSVCFVEKINKIEPIEGADKIELITIGNYSCIVQKKTHVIGELIIIATTDAVIPEKIAKDLNIKNYLKNGDKVKTIKLKGIYSECVTIPISYIEKNITLYQGKDMMSILGIYKYEPEIKLSFKNEKNSINNNFKVYYKFPNIKNTKNIFNENDLVQVTRKIHGTNARFGIVKKEKISFWIKIKKLFRLNNILDYYEYIYGSHNVQNNGGVWEKISNKFLIKDRLIYFIKKNKIDIGNGIILYGEIYGDGIQPKYNYGLKNDINIIFFDIYLKDKYLSHERNKMIYDNLSVFFIAPLPYTIPLYIGKYDENKINEFVKDSFIDKTNIPHEGVVIKDILGDRNKVVKVINPDYLVNNGKSNKLDSTQEFNH